MNVLIVRSKVKPEHADEVEHAVHDLFAAIEQAQPQGIRYASGRLADGVTYIAQLQVDDGIENPLPALPEFREFQQNLKQWLAEPPTPEQLTVVGTYRLFKCSECVRGRLPLPEALRDELGPLVLAPAVQHLEV